MKHTIDSESLHPLTNVRGVMVTGLALIAVAFGGFGAWAAFAPLQSAIIAPGVLKVAMNRKTVQHFEGGIVKSILVKDGDQVRNGQRLVVLSDERVSAALQVLSQQLDVEQAKLARLQAERDELAVVTFPTVLTERSRNDARIAQLLLTERSAFDAKRRGLREQLALIDAQMHDIKQEISALRVQTEADASAAGMMEEELTAHEELQRKNFVSKMAVLRLRRGYEDYHVRRGARGAETAKAQQKTTELQARAANLRNDVKQRATDEIAIATARIAELEERRRASLDAVERQAVLAPIAGTVVGMKVFTLGGVVRPGEPLMDIVPTNTPLIIEARLNVDDVDQVRDGMDAKVRLTALAARSAVPLDGKLVYVSADQLESELTHAPYYKVHVKINETASQQTDPLAARLQAGMQAEVFLQTGARTALDYLLEPVMASLRRGGKEF
jgi:HlyD family type I secretion membrane fusion protein